PQARYLKQGSPGRGQQRREVWSWVSPFINQAIGAAAPIEGAHVGQSLFRIPCSKHPKAHQRARPSLLQRPQRVWTFQRGPHVHLGRIAPWERQRPQHRESKEGRANIEQRCVWNSLNEGLAVLGAGEKAITVDDCVV